MGLRCRVSVIQVCLGSLPAFRAPKPEVFAGSEVLSVVVIGAYCTTRTPVRAWVVHCKIFHGFKGQALGSYIRTCHC